jgi:hypothetical protein
LSPARFAAGARALLPFLCASSVLLLLFSAASFLFDWSARQRRQAPVCAVDFLIQPPLSKILVGFAEVLDCVRILAGEIPVFILSAG